MRARDVQRYEPHQHADLERDEPSPERLPRRTAQRSASPAGGPVDDGAHVVQRFATAVNAGIHDVPSIAARGVSGAGGSLPHLDAIQRSFGRHEVGGIRSFIGGAAHEAAAAIGAAAYATGDAVAFSTSPDLALAAHEAAHVVQQRGGVQLAGGVGSAGDEYEQHADAVADLVVRGQSAESLLDRYAGGGGGGRSAVQKWDPPGGGRSASERAEIERTQSWDPTMDPLVPGAGAASAAVGAAMAANRELGFSAAHVAAIRRAFGVPARPGAFDRVLVEAITAFQRDHAIVTTTPGVLDEATIFASDFGMRWAGASGAPRYYERNAPWNDLDDARLQAFRTALGPPLHVVGSDLVLSEPRRGHRHAIVTTRFVQQVYNWQFWHNRAEGLPNGHLDDADLVALGLATAPTPVTAPAVATGEAATSTGEVAPAEPAIAPVEEEAPAVEAAPTRLTPAQLRSIQRRLHDLIPELPRTRAPDQSLPPRLTALRDELAAGIAPNEWLAQADLLIEQEGRPRAIANALISAVLVARGRHVDPPSRHTRTRAPAAEGAPPPAPDGTVPGLERRSPEEARAHLEEANLLVDDSTLTPGGGGWDARVVGGRAGTLADQADVVARATASVAGMDALEARIRGWHARLAPLLLHPDDTAPILEALAELRTAHLGGELRAPTDLPRGAWQPTWPRTISAHPEHPFVTAREWSRRFTAVLRELPRRRQHYEELASRDPRSEFSRVGGASVRTVDVDLHATGVEVTRAHGGRLSQSEMRLDTRFADALVRFLEDIRGLGVTTMRTNGLLRHPLSFEDTHPRGQAADICGFVIDGQEIHLRNGRENPDGYASGAGEFSDWHNTAGRLRGQSPSAIMHAITARMARYFSMIVGPGHNAAHNNHWHVQLTGGDGATDTAERASVMVVGHEDAPAPEGAGVEGPTTEAPVAP